MFFTNTVLALALSQERFKYFMNGLNILKIWAYKRKDVDLPHSCCTTKKGSKEFMHDIHLMDKNARPSMTKHLLSTDNIFLYS